MRLDGRRESSNVEDRRGKTATKAAGGIGIGGIVIYLIISFLGGDPSQVMQQMQQQQATEYVDNGKDYSEVDKELVQFTKRILAGTEDVWTKEFKKMGRTYQPATLVIFDDEVQSGCGNATSASGPFYCSADQSVYIDLSFFRNMRKTLGADGDFAYAYVIAHEVGHHVQHLLGILGQARQQQANMSKTESNQVSVRLELQADFFAGLWAYHDNKMFGSLEDGDIEEALNAASKIGDDYLQKQAYGRTMPETFNHGTSAQRMKWLKKGLSTGDFNQSDTFSPSYALL